MSVDDDSVVSKLKRDFNRLTQPTYHVRVGFDDQTIDHNLDRVISVPVDLDLVFQSIHFTVNTDPGETFRRQSGQLFLKLTFSSANDLGEHVHPLTSWVEHH